MMRHIGISAYTIALLLNLASSQGFNPTILQDSRDLPKVDGTFGFLYRTEDGIAHAAKGDSNGVIQGRFSYTDPTGLKVNYNYFTGSVTPQQTRDSGQYQPEKYQQQQQPQYEPQSRYQQPQPQYQPRAQPVQYDYEDNSQYADPVTEYVPITRPVARAQNRGSSRNLYSAQYRDPSRRTRPVPSNNEVYDYAS